MPLSPPIQVRFTPEQLALLVEMREKMGLSFGEQIRMMINEHLVARDVARGIGRAVPNSQRTVQVDGAPMPATDVRVTLLPDPPQIRPTKIRRR